MPRSILMKITLTCLAALFAFSTLIAQDATPAGSKNDYFKVISQKDGELIYEFDFPKPEITGHTLSSPFFEATEAPGEPRLLKINYLLELPEGGATALPGCAGLLYRDVRSLA